MIDPAPGPTGPALRAYLAASRAIPLVARPILRRRLARGKELPHRWREKLGEPGLPRPDGPLVWLHAVGLGETLALRGLIAALADQLGAALLGIDADESCKFDFCVDGGALFAQAGPLSGHVGRIRRGAFFRRRAQPRQA